MCRVIAILGVLLALPITLPANEFDWLVREFSRKTGAKPTHIPFFGLARFIVAAGHPAGARDLRLAVFEHVEGDPRTFSDLSGATLGRTWKPIVRVRSSDGEATNIYARPNGKDLRILVTSFENSEATFVEVCVRPDELMKFVDEHHHSHQQWASLEP